jgi:asparagine N-glycosylation enzyme membrane subunit Stt3
VIVKVSSSSLKDGRWYEYLVRFVLGGAATVFTGLIASGFGPAVGGLFLALPAIFCASATLIEQHEERRKREAGLSGRRRGQQAAALDAVGAALGSIGMLGFALVFMLTVERSAPAAFALALLAWCVVCLAAWWGWERVRALLRSRRTQSDAPSSKRVDAAGTLRR